MKTSSSRTFVAPRILESLLLLGANGAYGTQEQRSFGSMKSFSNKPLNACSFTMAYLARRQKFDRWEKFRQLFGQGFRA